MLYGDCLEILPTVEMASVDMVLCDPPYGITRNGWDKVIPFEPLWKEYRRVVKPNGAIVLFGCQPFTSALVMSNLKEFRYTLVWAKTAPTGFLNANRMPLRKHEDIVVFYRSLPTYNPQKTHGHPRKVATAVHKRKCKETTNYGKHGLSSYDSTERYPTSVLSFPSDKQKSAVHPTQKPVALLEYLIRTYTNVGETVLDNCAGSGSVGIACDNAGRNFIGIELDDSAMAAGA